MPKFKKLVVTPGVHNVGRIDGRSESEALTEERLRTWVENTNRLRALGVSIPAPFAHQDKDHHFPLPVIRIGTDGATLADAYNPANGLTWDAQMNGGFWEDLAIDPETKGISAVVDAPGELSDANSPAGKVGSTVKETSVFVMGPRKIMVNGKEHEIGEHLAHVAMCLHPAQPGQRNFEPITDLAKSNQFSPADLKMAMSFCMADLISTPQVPTAPGNMLQDPTKSRDAELDNLLAMLRNVCFIDLPESTTRESLVNDLSLALRQKSADQQEQEKEEDKLTQRPSGTDVKSPSIAMSLTSNGFVPLTNGSQTTGTQGGAVVSTSADTMLVMMMNNLVGTKRDSLKKRIDQLVAHGRCTKQYADSKLYPRITALVMSADQLQAVGGDTSKIRDVVEDLIEGLEEAQPLTMSLVDGEEGFEIPPGAIAQEVPDAKLADLSDKDSDEILAMSFDGNFGL